MSRQSTIVRTLLCSLIVVATVAIAVGASRASAQSTIQDRVVGDRVLSRVHIFNLEDTVARLDTVTGEVHLFTGDVRRPGTRGQWRLYASGVGQTSGYLQIQTPAGVEAYPVLFLVDIVTGDSWVLTRRGTGRATWDRVDVFRR